MKECRHNVPFENFSAARPEVLGRQYNMVGTVSE
jgi:hypothetical protein